MLEEYEKKRNFEITAEPPAEVKSRQTGSLRFVVQKHAARRLHYDLRLELNGVLVSWAVPKGPSLNINDKRLAVQTEDHPFDYQWFEGNIPQGEYGAGSMIIWDAGTYGPDWSHIPNPSTKDDEEQIKKALAAGKITFVLHGEKLHGSWTLVRLNKTSKEWLLRKNRDEFANDNEDLVELDRSVSSGRTIEEVREGRPAAVPLVNTADLPGARQGRLPKTHEPMLATLVDKPFNRENWIYEPKMDGIRTIARISGDKVQLLSRRGLDISAQYPSVVKALATTNTKLLLDGEIVALDEKGRPNFQRLQQRSGLSRAEDIARAEERIPVVYYVFDILFEGRTNLEGVKLAERKKLLKQFVPVGESVRLVSDFDDGVLAFNACIQNGLEGIVAKNLDSIYEPGKRSRAWCKVKGIQSAEFLICGYSAGAGARGQTFGSLILGYRSRSHDLVYAGGVGTGFDGNTLRMLSERMAGLHRKTSPLSNPPRQKGIQWLRPELVAEVKYAELTKSGLLRAPVFLRIREDIAPDQVGEPPALAG